MVAAILAGCGSPVSSGGSAPSPRITCTGIPATKCDEAVASVARSLPNSRPVSIEVSCVSGTCTPESGAMDTVVTLADGSTLRSSTLSWSEPGAGAGTGSDGGVAQPVPPGAGATAKPAEPAVPVEPTCQGVPVAMCRTMAETAFGELDQARVIGILVRCGEPPCTNEHGAGDTIVTYADGTTGTSSWEYAGS
jgi:hypothetical protein